MENQNKYLSWPAVCLLSNVFFTQITRIRSGMSTTYISLNPQHTYINIALKKLIREHEKYEPNPCPGLSALFRNVDSALSSVAAPGRNNYPAQNKTRKRTLLWKLSQSAANPSNRLEHSVLTAIESVPIPARAISKHSIQISWSKPDMT